MPKTGLTIVDIMYSDLGTAIVKTVDLNAVQYCFAHDGLEVDANALATANQHRRREARGLQGQQFGGRAQAR